MSDVLSLKEIACKDIDNRAAELHSISQEIWSHPELSFNETFAHKLLTDYLEKQGFAVERHFVLDTGFRAIKAFGKGPNIVVVCEYDALPEIGHACGHNLIAALGVGAGVAILQALQAASHSGKQLGQITVLGTPAEEEGGGKIDMINAGAFEGVDLAMMCHPAPINLINGDSLTAASQRVTVKYRGKASHAAAFPWEGVNALDAAVMAYTNVSVMRQQMKPDWRIHGVIVKGGTKPNIIPEETELRYYIRALSFKQMQALQAKATHCFQAAAVATGCQVELEWGEKPYANMISNPVLSELFEKNLSSLGKIDSRELKVTGPSVSTDMGNVAHLVPSIHPMFYIGSSTAFNHAKAFTAVAGDAEAQPYTLQQAKALAMTALDVFCQPGLLATIKSQFEAAVAKENAQ